MIDKTFHDVRIEQMVALHCLQLREDRFQKAKEIRLRKLKNKIKTMPEIDLQGYVSEADKGFKNKAEKRKARKQQKYLTKRQAKLKKLKNDDSHWSGLESWGWLV